MKKPEPSLGPVTLVLVAIASVQMGASFAKSIFAAAHPATLAFLRAAIAAVMLLTVSRPSLRGRAPGAWLLVAGYGVCLSGMNLLIYLSFSRIPIGVAVTLEFLGPLTLAVVGSRRLVDLVWVVLAGTGVMLLGAGPLGVDLTGAILALGAGALWAGYIVLAGPVARAWPAATGLTAGSIVGALVLLVPGLAYAGNTLVQPPIWGVMVAVALLSTVIPYALELYARRQIEASTFGILMSLEPAAAALFAGIVLGERLGWVQWVAMACVIVASVGAIRVSARRPVETRSSKGHN